MFKIILAYLIIIISVYLANYNYIPSIAIPALYVFVITILMLKLA